MRLYGIIKDLVSNPGAEKEPEPWLTRLFAHKAVGAYLFTALLLPVMAVLDDESSLVAAICASLLYATVEILEWVGAKGRRNLALFWDCVLDWVGVTTKIALVWAAWENRPFLMLILMTVGLAISYAGVWKRSR